MSGWYILLADKLKESARDKHTHLTICQYPYCPELTLIKINMFACNSRAMYVQKEYLIHVVHNTIDQYHSLPANNATIL